MNRSLCTALAAVGFLVACAGQASANDSPIAFFSLPPEPITKQADGALKTQNSRASRAATRASDGPAAADISKLAGEMGVPHALALSVCRIESHCRYGMVGRAGERGPLQIKLQTARGLGYAGSAAGLNGYTGAYWGMKHLQVAYKTCGTARGAARLHNAGLASSCGGSAYASRVVAGL